MNNPFIYIPLYYGGIVGFKYAANYKLKYKFDKETINDDKTSLKYRFKEQQVNTYIRDFDIEYLLPVIGPFAYLNPQGFVIFLHTLLAYQTFILAQRKCYIQYSNSNDTQRKQQNLYSLGLQGVSLISGVALTLIFAGIGIRSRYRRIIGERSIVVSQDSLKDILK